jgi:hypothetical protein
MVASRSRPKGTHLGPFGLIVAVLSFVPTRAGYQDYVALLARQPEVSQRVRAHMLASPFGTIHAATFSFPQPVGTLIPPPPTVRLASLNFSNDDSITGAIARDFTAVPLTRSSIDYPTVLLPATAPCLIPFGWTIYTRVFPRWHKWESSPETRNIMMKR